MTKEEKISKWEEKMSSIEAIFSNRNYCYQIGNKFRNARERLGLTQEYMAYILDVNEKTIRNWEKGIGYKKIKLYLKLTVLCDISLRSLILDEEDFSESE